MRRPLLALALLGAALVSAAQQASTSGNDLPTSATAVYRGTTVDGATMLSTGYTVAADKIVSVQPKLRGIGLVAGTGGLLPKTVTARMGSDLPVPCTVTASALLNVLTRLAEATYDCPGLLERADRPRPLRLTVS